jgi:outer membrane protein assembly factor BamD (BamD/ComL family)
VGNKPGRRGKYILFYLAAGCLAAAVNIVACAPVQDKFAEIRAHRQLEQYREDMADGQFNAVISHSKEVLADSETKPPADAALYALGEVYAHHGYEGSDYALSREYFEKLAENFPDSTLASEARTFISLFDTIAAREKAMAEAGRQSPQPAPAPPEEEKTSPGGPARVVEDQNFDEAIQQNMRILEQAGEKKPADRALYTLGLLYAHVDNPAKDYKKSQIYFHVLTKQFPESEYAEEGRIWLGLFETIDKMQQIDMEIEQQKKQLIR